MLFCTTLLINKIGGSSTCTESLSVQPSESTTVIKYEALPEGPNGVPVGKNVLPPSKLN